MTRLTQIVVLLALSSGCKGDLMISMSTDSDGGTSGTSGTSSDDSSSSSDAGSTGTSTGIDPGSTSSSGSSGGGDSSSGNPDGPGLDEDCHFISDHCADGLTCVLQWSNDDQWSEFVCRPYDGDGPGDLGEPCDAYDQCANGYACVGATSLNGDGYSYCDAPNAECCSPYCKVDADCPQGLLCTEVPGLIWDTLSPNLKEYGLECFPRFCIDAG